MTQAIVAERPTQTDEELIERTKDGDDQAFQVLIHRYQNRVFSLVHRIVHMPEDTEDLAQEVFVTLHRSMANFRGECAFSTWMYRITVNHCKNRLKYLQRRNFHRADAIEETAESELNAPVSITFANPEQLLLGRELEGVIQKELSELEEEHRIVLILRDLEHLSYDEISDITGLALGTVKSRLHRARSALKERMERYFQ